MIEKPFTILKAIKNKKSIKFKWVFNKTLCDWPPEEEC